MLKGNKGEKVQKQNNEYVPVAVSKAFPAYKGENHLIRGNFVS